MPSEMVRRWLVDETLVYTRWSPLYSFYSPFLCSTGLALKCHPMKKVVDSVGCIEIICIFANRYIRCCYMNRQQMIQKIAEYFKTQPVLKAWLFGSFSRGEERPDSDVDILVMLDQEAHVGLFKLSGMHLDLQDLLQKNVDLVTDKGLMPFARPSVERDKELIYERTA